VWARRGGDVGVPMFLLKLGFALLGLQVRYARYVYIIVDPDPGRANVYRCEFRPWKM
jgi:hypothetical protein